MDPNKLENMINDIIGDNVEIEDIAYSDWCSECHNGPKGLDYRSIELAAREIIKMLKEQKVI
jgi:hypothetical protein